MMWGLKVLVSWIYRLSNTRPVVGLADGLAGRETDRQYKDRASKQSKEMKELTERNQAIRRWRKRGLTYRDIGTIFGNLSRQRIHQIVSRKQAGFWRRLWIRAIR